MVEILVIEDNPEIQTMLTEFLILQDYQVKNAYSGTEALIYLAQEKYDLILLDLMLPGMEGEELLVKFRTSNETPVIVLSAKDTIESKVNVLSSGADDYLVKPFDLQELKARIEVQLRKSKNSNTNSEENTAQVYDVDGLVYNPEFRIITYQDQEITLTPLEFQLLSLFIKHPKRIYTKDDLFRLIWNEEPLGDDKTINVHNGKIRKKLSHITGREWIETIWGIGFRLNSDNK